MQAMTATDLSAFLVEHFPQAAGEGLTIEHVDDTRIRVRLPVAERHLRPGGTVSGPTLMWLADCGTYLGLLARIGPVALAVTTSLNVNFMRRAEAGKDLIGEGRLMKVGRTLAVAEMTIRSDGSDETVAHATLTYSIPPDRKEWR